MVGSLQAMRYILAVGPPMSEMMPVKPGVLSRMASISLRTDFSERFWMMRPSCSVIEQKVQPPKQPRMMLIEKRIISHAGILASPKLGCGARAEGRAYTASLSGAGSGIG